MIVLVFSNTLMHPLTPKASNNPSCLYDAYENLFLFVLIYILQY